LLIKGPRAKPRRVFTAVHGEPMGSILFTWELRERAKGRRWFYSQFERLLSELPPKSWRKLGGSVYLVRKEDSDAFEELLRRFEGPDLTWHKLKAEVVISCDFTAVHTPTSS